jgi:hypothetical protein
MPGGELLVTLGTGELQLVGELDVLVPQAVGSETLSAVVTLEYLQQNNIHFNTRFELTIFKVEIFQFRCSHFAIIKLKNFDLFSQSCSINICN